MNQLALIDDSGLSPSGKVCAGKSHTKPPIVTGQCAQVLNLIREHQPILSLMLTADHAIPEAAARVHNLRAAGWDIRTHIHAKVMFRGVERRNVASYSMGTPEWPAPGFFDEVGDQAIIPRVIGRGHQAYVEAKRWIETNHPNLTPAQYAQACRLAAKIAEV